MANGSEGYDVGFDLGTTYSVIAVKGNVNTVDGYPDGVYLEECDVTVIPSHFGELTIPSVFWTDPDTGEAIVGAEAKQKAEDGLSPIMFSKRSIGTDEPLKLHNRTYTAKEVATEILKYLKSCAEQALGGPVRRAVITHPAYFKPNQIQETREAAEAAGIDMTLEEQLLMEPTAASLAYTINDARDPLRILTYDLGGGTFDVTVLERHEGVTSITSFDGDALLGGYNFDRALMQWLLDKVAQSGRLIPYDENDVVDRGRRAKLLQVAERAKLDLSRQNNDKLPITISAGGILVDHEGVAVQINERINREQYTELIEHHLEETIRCCRRALSAANVDPDDLNTVALVGGSTHGPWVSAAVRKAFGVASQPFHPDLCVAVGAAIQAAGLRQLVSGEGVELILDAPARSVMSETTLAGFVRVSSGKALPASECRAMSVRLNTPAAGVLGPVSLNDDGKFVFEDVGLIEGGPSRFVIELLDQSGTQRLQKEFEILYDAEATESEIPNVLPKPVYVKVANGLKLMAERGVSLPTSEYTVEMKKLFGDDVVEIPIVQDDDEVGRVIITKIPPEAGEGAPVIIKVSITEKNAMVGKATVQSLGGSVAAECDVEITFPPIRIPSLAELRARFKELEGQRSQLLSVTNDPGHRTMLGGAGEQISENIEHLFGELEPDKQEIYRRVRELENLVEPPEDEMQPPRSRFDRYIKTCRTLITTGQGDPEVESYESVVTQIETDGNNAYQDSNARLWTLANENIERTYEQLNTLLSGPQQQSSGPPAEPTPTTLQKENCRHRIEELRSNLNVKQQKIAYLDQHDKFKGRFESRCAELRAIIDAMAASVEKVDDDTEPRQASARLQIAMKPEDRVKKKTSLVDDRTGVYI